MHCINHFGILIVCRIKESQIRFVTTEQLRPKPTWKVYLCS